MPRIAPLRTARLSMRPYRNDDLDALHGLWTDAAVRRWLWDDQVIDRATAAAAIQESIDCTATHGFGHWAVSLHEDETVIGFCGLRLTDGGPEVELLYGLHPRLWGRGLASEGAAAWLRAGFEQFGRQRIWALTDAPNTRSEAVMQRLGMRFTERFRQANGLDGVRYVITREEWQHGGRE
ncbi:MAG: GNAT family N-acetyltransferase [Deltaproteobacteria bacterium]|nr:GNAT family N-acetyltransferase [Deltaproteobacteria bacterium]